MNSKAVLKLFEDSTRLQGNHVKTLIEDEVRNSALTHEFHGIVMDNTRQKIDKVAFENLLEFAGAANIMKKIESMKKGKVINETEKRVVWHPLLRATEPFVLSDDCQRAWGDIQEVNRRIRAFASHVRSGDILGATEKKLTSILCIGIGGSYLGPEFIFEALRTNGMAGEAAKGRKLRFLANVDPIDVKRATEDLSPESTLVIIVSKTFTTAETILNAKTIKSWLLKSLKTEKAVSQHMCAVSTNIRATSEFGIPVDRVFGFWDWVGGRFSVCSAVGMLPLTIHYGNSVMQQFLMGCSTMDNHFFNASISSNLPVIMALVGFWNSTIRNIPCVAILPYCQALLKFPAHVQQLMMESNGKRVSISGDMLDYSSGPVVYGEPGTNSQHSFFQLLHQGRISSTCEFIGFVDSQCDIHLCGESTTNHDELMSNFFAQPDALAIGKSENDLMEENCPRELIPHRLFPGDRCSTVLLLPCCDPFYVGMLLALYEHRTAVEGFLLNINSFDQYGVELGKTLAKEVKGILISKRSGNEAPDMENLIAPTRRLLNRYCEKYYE